MYTKLQSDCVAQLIKIDLQTGCLELQVKGHLGAAEHGEDVVEVLFELVAYCERDVAKGGQDVRLDGALHLV